MSHRGASRSTGTGSGKQPPATAGGITGPSATRAAGGRSPGARDNQAAPYSLRVVAAWSWRIIVVLAAVWLLFLALDQVLLVVVAIFLALVFTAVLRPFVNLLARIMPRGAATALSLIIAVLTIAGVLAYVGYSVADQWPALERQLNNGIATLVRLVRDSPIEVQIPGDDLETWAEYARWWLVSHREAVVTRALAGAGSLAVVLTTLALATFCTVFFLTRGAEMWRWFVNQLPRRARGTWVAGGEAAWSTFAGYTAGTFIVAAADAVLAALALLVLGVPLAVPLAVLVFIGAFIPLVGAPAAMLIAMVVALAANGVVSALLVGAAIALIGQLEGHLLQPLVMGREVSLHPVVVALSVTTGALVAGILGAVVAVPLTSVAWAVFSRLRSVDPPRARGEDGSTAGSDPGESAPV